MAAAPLIAFYGDDFTGSTDALEVLAAAGLRAVLFTDVPSAEQLARYQGLEAVGIAGHTRSLTPDEMEGALPACYAALKASGAPILHYKVCSTFDSSAGIGSFGRAMDIARREIGTGTIPVVVGAPRLGRYSFFGTLFARDNADGSVHRIDRHATMSRHPTTPMREGDMRRHIGAQTEQRIALLPAPAIGGTEAGALASLAAAMEDAPDALLIDIADETAESRVGLLLERMAQAAAPLFVLGSSGVEYALIAHWTAQGRMRARREMPAPSAVDRLLVVSGSCSPVTGGQIAAAIEDGFAEIVIDPVALVRDGEASARDAVATAVELLESGRSVIAHTSTGREDPREAALIAHFAGRGVSEDEARLQGGRALAAAAGRLLRDVLDRVELERFVVAGGDTSTAAMGMLGVEALEMMAPLSPGAPLCRILAPGHRLDGRQIALKGGQLGAPAFFSQVREGRV